MLQAFTIKFPEHSKQYKTDTQTFTSQSHSGCIPTTTQFIMDIKTRKAIPIQGTAFPMSYYLFSPFVGGYHYIISVICIHLHYIKIPINHTATFMYSPLCNLTGLLQFSHNLFAFCRIVYQITLCVLPSLSDLISII